MILAIIAGFVFYELPNIDAAPRSPPTRSTSRSRATSSTGSSTTPTLRIARARSGRCTCRSGAVVDLKVVAPDVIHSWWIPALGGKIQAIPGRDNHTWFQAQPGSYDGQCAELCGVYHASMNATVQAESQQAVPALPRDLARDDRQADLERRLRDVPREPRAGRLRACDRNNSLLIQPNALAGDHPQRLYRPAGSMPPVGDTWTRQEHHALVAYVKKHIYKAAPRERRMAASSEAAYPVGWKNGRVASWLVTVDHKRIGILYIATSIFFFALGGVLAVLMRAQLATPERALLTKDSYNEVLTMHGTTMVFLVVVPIMAGFGNFLVPLMIGARDMAFPRLNALSYWLFASAGSSSG